jgi:hypothetical protein
MLIGVTSRELPSHYHGLIGSLDAAKTAILRGHYPALARAARTMMDLVPDDSRLVKPLQVVATRLAQNPKYVPVAVGAAMVAAKHAQTRKLKLQVVRFILDHAPSLPKLADRIDAAVVSARNAQGDITLANNAASIILKDVDGLPWCSQRIAAAKVALVYTTPGTDLAQRAAEKLSRLQNSQNPVHYTPTKPAAASSFVQRFHL